MKILELLSESNGQLSNMRLNTTVMVFTGCGIIAFATYAGKLDANVIAAGTMLVTIALTGKVAQKAKEETGLVEPPKL